MTIRFVCEYNGTKYSGFQIQKNGNSIQAELESALSKCLIQDIKITGSGRTDAGVHARGQVCSFVLVEAGDLDLFKLTGSVNAFLPEDIGVRDFMIVKDGFNARFDAKWKTYVYRCYVCKQRRPLLDDFYLRLYKDLDIAVMKDVAKILCGTHDFSAFSCIHTDKSDKVRTIDIDIQFVDDRIYFKFGGNGFLRNMVRILVGTLIEVGEGKISPNEINDILQSGDRKRAGKTADAKGLTLESVEY
ncbi:MAG: tRNA pseudouridine(38-40) synthase TruA [Firmicutes bacterium]|nr:tRNA pseudouridine(38-40) synthase TruA [Bacillota bacterium]